MAPGLLPATSTMNVANTIEAPAPEPSSNAPGAGGPAANAPEGSGATPGFGQVLSAVRSGTAADEPPAEPEDGEGDDAGAAASAESGALLAAAIAAAVGVVVEAAPVTPGAGATGGAAVAPVVAGPESTVPAGSVAATAQPTAADPAGFAADLAAGDDADGTPVPAADAHADAPATDATVQAERSVGEGEPGRRETNGGAVGTGSRSLGHAEAVQAKGTGGGGPSAPSPLSPSSASDGAVQASAGSAGGAGTGDTGDGQPEKAPRPGVAGLVEEAAGGGRTPHVAGRQFAPLGTAQPGAENASTVDATRGEAAPGLARAVQAAPATDGVLRPGPNELPPPALQPAVSHGPPLAAAPASEPLVARDVDHVLRLGQLHAVPGRDGGEMRLELSPEGLGQVEVRVAVHANAVQATLTAHDDHARQTLEANRAALETALGRANLRLEGFTVGLGQHQERHEGGGDGRRLAAGAAPGAAPLAAVVGGAPEPVAVANGLSVRA